MATLTKAESKHMYSWWWDSHISPKNSKWLQENLADTDAKVKQMIKLVEVDEDSFARRAEMYYKKRPELMKLIEEFYRAYRALAERYDHATGVIKQAHQTMAEVFPNQVPFHESDDVSFSSADDCHQHTSETLVSLRAFHDLDELDYAEKDEALGSLKPKRCSIFAEGRARKSLKFHDADTKAAQIMKNEGCTEKAQAHSDSERLGRSETDIQALKEALSRLESEKQAGMLECEESFRRLTKLETEVMRAQDDSVSLHERASNAEAEVQSLKESLSRLEGEREASLQKYHQCLDRISNLESKAEKDALILTEELVQINVEKEAYLAKYMEALEKIANLENKLLLAEDKASMTSDRAYNAEKEVESLKEAFNRATEEKEAASLQHQICLDKLKMTEEQCLVLERSNKSMQDELGKLQGLHSQTQDELRAAAAELQRRVQLMKDMEIHGQCLQDENKSLSVSMKSMQDEITALCEKLTMMEKLTEKRAVLEHCLSELSAELDDNREKIKALEKSYQLVMKEKSDVIEEKENLNSHLEIVTENLESLAARNACLDNSLFQANEELEALRVQSKNLEEQREEELDKAVDSELEVFITRNIIHDLQATNSSLISKCDKLLESSKLSEKLLLELEYENIEQQEEENYLSEQIKILRMGMFQLLKVLDVDLEIAYEGNLLDDQIVLHRLLIKLDDMRNDLCKSWDENQKLSAEKSVLESLHENLKEEVTDLKVLINTLQLEFRNGNNQLSSLHKDMPKLLQSHEELILKVTEGNRKEDLLAGEVNDLRKKILKMQDHNSCLVAEALTLDILSFIFKNNVTEKSKEINQLNQNMRIMESMLDRYDEELEESRITNNQLELELAREREEFSQKEMELLEAVMENERLRISKKNTDTELHRILKKQIQTEEMVEKSKAEAELWETVAGTFFIELQTSSVREALFKEKLAELTKEYKCIEAENSSKGLEFVQMMGRLELLEGENSQVKAQLAKLIPSLKDSLAALESHAMLTDNEDDFYQDTASSHKASKDEVVSIPPSDKFPDLQEIAVRMKAVEKKVMEMKKLSQERSLRALKSRSSRSRRGSRRVPPSDSTEKQVQKSHQKNASYPSEASEIMMKDIILDQPSETRWSNRRRLYSKSESDDQILELWETIDQSQSIDLTVPKRDNENDSKKVLESLAYDVQRLANLQITVQDLKHKVVNTENSNPIKGKGIEYVRVKEQLYETDKAVTKLLDVNSKLMKKLDNYSASSMEDSPELGDSKRRTNVFHQARRCSQKVGRLQLEVQKIQFVLLNLDGGNSKMGRVNGTRVSDRNSKILLKDYLYVGARIPRRKKAHFCGCVQPRTSGD